MEIPKLSSDRLELVPLDLTYESAYIRFYTDEGASKFYGGPLSASAASHRLLADMENWRLSGFGVWAIKPKETGLFIGVCGFWQGKGWPTELTWWILPSARGKGFAKEASKLAIFHAYEHWQWRVVETYMKDDNIPAQKLAQSLGGQLIGRRMFPDQIERNVYLFPKEKFSAKV